MTFFSWLFVNTETSAIGRAHDLIIWMFWTALSHPSFSSFPTLSCRVPSHPVWRPQSPTRGASALQPGQRSPPWSKMATGGLSCLSLPALLPLSALLFLLLLTGSHALCKYPSIYFTYIPNWFSVLFYVFCLCVFHFVFFYMYNYVVALFCLNLGFT